MQKETDNLYETIELFMKGELDLSGRPKPPDNPNEQTPKIETPLGAMELEDYVKFSLVRALVPGISTQSQAILTSRILTHFSEKKADFINQKKAKGGPYYEDLINIAVKTKVVDFYEFSKKQKELAVTMLADEDILTPKELMQRKFWVRYWEMLEKTTEHFANNDHLNA